MQRYDTYKDSGVKWLGEIPSHWEMIKSKYLWKESFSISENGNEELLSVSQYDGITPAKGDSRSESLKGYKIVSENDLVINIMLAWMGGLGVSKFDGIVSPAYCVYKLTKDSNPKYLHYLYKTPLYLAEFARHSTGVIPSRWRMYTDDFGQVVSLLPPRKEQDAIVEYLDEKMAKIDAAIAQQQKMIDLLNERKQIIINRAVTKGLNPNAKMKDSGVEWIGEVPEHWKVRKLKYLVSCNDETLSENEDKYLKIKYVEIGDVDSVNGVKHYTEYSFEDAPSRARRITQIGDVIVSTVRTYLKAVSKIEEENLIVSTGFAVLRAKSIIAKDYLAYSILSECFINKVISESDGTSYPAINASDLINIKVALPPLSEQLHVVSAINNRLKVIDSIIKKYNKQIALLQERKQIIINDVVTGKVKVV